MRYIDLGVDSPVVESVTLMFDLFKSLNFDLKPSDTNNKSLYFESQFCGVHLTILRHRIDIELNGVPVGCIYYQYFNKDHKFKYYFNKLDYDITPLCVDIIKHTFDLYFKDLNNKINNRSLGGVRCGKII